MATQAAPASAQGGAAGNPPAPSKEQIYIHLTARAVAAERTKDLQFIIVNETIALAPYRQAAFFEVRANGSPYLSCASGLVSVAESSPYTVWLNRFAGFFSPTQEAQSLSFEAASEAHQDGWQEWLPAHLLVLPLVDRHGKLLGFSMFGRDQAWDETEVSQLTHLHRVYAHCLAATLQQKRAWWSSRNFTSRPLFWSVTALVLFACFWIPVRLSTLAPAEVIALDAFSVAAPQDGVVHSFLVQPNAVVKKGDVLFTLDDTSVTNRFEVANKALATARAETLVAEQRAFDDARGKAALASSLGRVREKEAELAAVKAQMARVGIRAEKDGIAIFTDANDWIGRPVQTGERVMQLADPKDAGVLMWLPVKDALNLESGAEVKLFLHTKALSPIAATLRQTSYQATLSPDNVASYRLKAAFADTQDMPRIGLRGTARISGEWSTLGYYLFRRPITALREWVGF